MSPLFAQKIEMKFGSVKEKVSEVLFRDSNDSTIGSIDIAKMNPFNQLPNKVIEVDELGNKEYIVSQEEFLHLFPEQLRAKYNQYIDYYSISNAKIYSIAQAFKTSNRFLVLAYSLVAVSPVEHEQLAEKCLIYVYDSVMNEIYNHEVVPSINNYAAVTKEGKYLAIQNGTVDAHVTLYPDGIQIVDIKSNKVVYQIEATILGPAYYESCGMIKFIMMLPIGYRYVFLDERNDCLLFFDITSLNERLLEITKDGLIIGTSSEDTYVVKFKDMQIITLK